MKRIALVAALAALAACQQQEPAAEAEAAPDAAAAPAAAEGSMAADGKPAAGMYEVTTSKGEVFREEVNPDGTYVQTDKDGKVVETGKWVQKSPTQYCTTKDEEGAKEWCNTEGIDDKGVWTSTNDKGETATVKRVES
ncbi:MAG: hypothetical protein ACEQR8_05250 [Cypionkella sp.]